MNVKELLMSLSVERIVSTFAGRLDVPPEDMEMAIIRLTKFINDLREIEPIDTDYLILGICYIEEEGEFLDVCLYRKEDLAAGFDSASELAGIEGIEGMTEEEIDRLAHSNALPQSYAFEFSPWNEILGYEIDERNARDVGIAEFCAGVLFEMTFLGFTEDVVEQERQKLYEAIREAEEIQKVPEEEWRKNDVPVEQLFAEFGVSEQTEEEKREQDRRFCREALENKLRTYHALRKYVKSK